MNGDRWQRAKEVYHSVIEQEPQQREAFLTKACAGDESLRREVESLLACRPEAENLMASPALDVAARELAREQSGEPEPDLTGQTLTHYRILDKIGAGGMGVVYKAEDLRLGRVVALKFLSGELAGDKQALQRFQREARVISALNHPHICTLHDIGEHEGRAFLVMEHLAGETLAGRLAKGPLGVNEAVEICRQIAEGLEAAHEQGIIHRDLKPANVKIAPGGKVKILDFGLARALRDQAVNADVSHPPKTSDQKTQPGTVLGTAAYMSPEQARGKPVDKRADIWAFGCVLYECLTGKRAFGGETVTETIAALLKEEPDWQALPAGASENLRRVLRRCLQKDPDLRLRDIGDALIEIGEPAVHSSEAIPAPRRLPLRWLGAAAGLILLAGIAISLALIGYFQPVPTGPVVSTIKIEPGHWLAGMNRAAELQRPSRPAMAISSDNSFIVYSAIEENSSPGAKTGLIAIDATPDLGLLPQLYLRRMGETAARPVPGTEGGINPFLSPDNRWVGFWADRKLKKVPVEGGIAIELCDARLNFGANWGRDDRIVFSGWVSSGLSVVGAGGGTPQTLTTPDPKREESSHRLPVWLPSGNAVLFTVIRHSYDWKPRIAALRLDTGEWKVLLDDAADARYVPTGHLVFLRQGVLMAVRFDPSSLQVLGVPQPLVESVMQAFSTADSYNTSAGQFAFSDSGWLVYAAGGVAPEPKNSLVWVDQHGNEELVRNQKKPYHHPRLSPDGKKIVYGTLGQDSRIWVYDLARDTDTPVTDEGHASAPVWTATGKRLVFLWMKSGRAGAFWQPYDKSSSMEPFIRPAREELGRQSPDGRTIAIAQVNSDTRWDIMLFDTQSGKLTPFLNSRFEEAYPDVSPDGRWIAYTSTENKERSEVYVTDFPGKTLIRQISIGGGHSPMWSRDSRKLFYRGQGNMWVVDVQAERGFTPGKPVMLFNDAAYTVCSPLRCGDLSPDSQRFLMVKYEQRTPAPVTELILVQNWFEELKRLFSTEK